MSYKGNNERAVADGIVVTYANGGQLVSTATDVINYHGLPLAAKRCHKFPDRQLVDPLLSLGKLTTYGCGVTFNDNNVVVTNREGLVVLIGTKPRGRNVYTVPLPNGVPTTNSFPPTVTVPKICGIIKSDNKNHPVTVTHQPMTHLGMTETENKLHTVTKNKLHTRQTPKITQKHKNSHNSVNIGARDILNADLESTRLQFSLLL